MSRRDYWHADHAPTARSLVVAVSAIILNHAGDILMIKRADSGLWSIPGGAMEPGETVTEAVRREVREETGYDVRIDRLIGIFSDPAHVIEYSDGEVRQEFSICFSATPVNGSPRTSPESIAVQWMPLNEARHIVHPSIQQRIDASRSTRPYFT